MKTLTGTYRCDALLAKFLGGSEQDLDVSCKLPGCNSSVGDAVHLLSGLCPPLRPKLEANLKRGLISLSDSPILFDRVSSALQGSPEDWCRLLVDPTTDPSMISLKQQHGLKALLPLLRFSRSYIWCMHREHMKLKGKPHFLWHSTYVIHFYIFNGPLL